MKDIKGVIEKQKEFFLSGKTKNRDYRINNLKKLKRIIKDSEDKILEALREDLGKSNFEGYITEIGMVYEEINLMIKNLKKWSRREKVRSSLNYFPSKSYIYKEPYGVVLIIGPFNYPFQLIFAPLIGAIGAGNCAVLKPSEYSVNTSKLIEKLINDNFNEEFVTVIDPTGGKEVVSELLDQPFDYIFFTGSVRVGKIVMEKAAKSLIPITLELGGKSPCIVDKDANIKLSAKRIAWGKFLNAGQTCVAPDYLYIHKDIKEKFLKELVREIELQLGKNQKESPDYPRIISEREVKRLSGYLEEGKIYYGGEVSIEDRYISPTILVDVKENTKILEEEIFGPIFPVYDFVSLEDVIEKVNKGDKPLALYYFSEDKNKIEYVLKSTSSGGVTINDTIIHVASSYLPFGGVGNSGMGAYHGRASFDTFSHRKSVLKRGTFMELPIRFAPYGEKKMGFIRKMMK